MKSMVMFTALMISGSAFSKDQLIDLIGEGLQNSFNVEVTNHKFDIAQWSSQDLIPSFLPTVDFNARRSMTNSETFEGTEKISSSGAQNGIDISTSWTLWDNFESISKYRQGKIDFEIAKIEQKKSINGYILNLLEKYFDYQLLLNQGESIKLKKAQHQWSYEKAKELVKLGTKTKIDAYDAEITLENTKRQESEHNNNIRQALKDLQFLINPKSPKSIEPVDLLGYAPYFSSEFEKLIPKLREDANNILEKGSRTLAINTKSLESSRIGKEQQSLARWPKLGTTLGHSVDLSSYASPDAETTGPLQSSSVTLSLTWDVWDWFTIERRIRTATRQYKIKEINLQEQVFNERKEISKRMDTLDNLEKSIDTSRLILEKAQVLYSYSKELYILGRTTIDQLHDATDGLFQARITLSQRLKEKFLIRAKILDQVGQDIAPTS